MHFANEWILYSLIVLVPLCAILYFWLFALRERRIKRLGDPQLIERLCASRSLPRQKIKLRLVILAMIGLLFVLSRPQFGQKTIELKRRGIDLVVALDTSSSMLAEDVSPNRLDKARGEVSLLIDALQGDRIGLVGFAGRAFVQCPLTLDKGTARTLLSILDVDSIPLKGTSLAHAIEVSRGAFSAKDRKYKVLVLITDGEDHEGEVLEQARLAADEGLIIYTVGIGKKSGEPIPLFNKQGDRVGYKKNEQGEVIVTKLGEDLLKKVAAQTGGRYYHVVSGPWNLKDIYDAVNLMEKKELQGKMVTIYNDQYQLFLALVLLLLILEFFISERIVLALMMLISSVLCNPVFAAGQDDAAKPGFLSRLFDRFKGNIHKAQEFYESQNYKEAASMFQKAIEQDPKNKALYFNRGNALARSGKFEQAQRMFQVAAQNNQDPVLKAESYYNEGNAWYHQQKYEQALEAYKKALVLNPQDEDSKYNIELINHLLKTQPPQPQQNQNSSQDQNQDSEGNDDQNQQNQNGQNDQQQQQNDQQDQNDQNDQQNQDSQNDQNDQPNQDQDKDQDQDQNQNSQGDQDEDSDEDQDQGQDDDQSDPNNEDSEDEDQSDQDQDPQQDGDDQQNQNSGDDQNEDSNQPEDKQQSPPSGPNNSESQGQEQELSAAEAEMFLNLLDDNRDLHKEIKKKLMGNVRYIPEKDW